MTNLSFLFCFAALSFLPKNIRGDFLWIIEDMSSIVVGVFWELHFTIEHSFIFKLFIAILVIWLHVHLYNTFFYMSGSPGIRYWINFTDFTVLVLVGSVAAPLSGPSGSTPSAFPQGSATSVATEAASTSRPSGPSSLWPASIPLSHKLRASSPALPGCLPLKRCRATVSGQSAGSQASNMYYMRCIQLL